MPKSVPWGSFLSSKKRTSSRALMTSLVPMIQHEAGANERVREAGLRWAEPINASGAPVLLLIRCRVVEVKGAYEKE